MTTNAKPTKVPTNIPHNKSTPTTTATVTKKGTYCFQPSANTFLNSLGCANLYPVYNKILARQESGILFKYNGKARTATSNKTP